MSYIDAKRTNNEQILVWERHGDERVIRKFDAPHYFYVPHSEGDYTSIYGDKLGRLEFPTYKECQNARMDYKSDHVDLYESDIPAKFRVLSENYYNVPAPKLRVTFYDIEVDYLKEIPIHRMVDEPYAPINSVSFYHQWKDQYVLVAVPPPEYTGDEEQLRIDASRDVPLPENLDIILCKNERELLAHFVLEIEESDAICGWNSDFFDTPYVGQRLKRMDKQKIFFSRLSFNEGTTENPYYSKPRWGKAVDKFGNDRTVLRLFGRLTADYQRLFEKYEEGKYPSYALANIADTILRDPDTDEPTLPKLEYEGTLKSLYTSDFPFFVRYNIRDTEILKAFDDQLGYFALANEMYHLSCGTFSQVSGTIKLFEQAIVNYCHYELDQTIVPDGHPPEQGTKGGGIAGAYVLPPKVGWHSYVGSIDITSLYPSAIRAINISPETLLAQFSKQVGMEEVPISGASDEIAKNSATSLRLVWEDGKVETAFAYEWRELFEKKNYAVSGFGTVFDQNKAGIIPTILTEWFNMRLKYKGLLAEARASGNKDKIEYYDKLQYTFKIKLNSSYGALSNAYFRFYDTRLGESVTATGRRILRHQCAKANEVMTGDYEYLGDAVVYGDTDSTYFETWTEDVDSAVKVADHVAAIVNKSFPEFMRETFLLADCNIITAERELVSDQGIFINKKRYFLHLADKEGTRVDKLKVMGLETKKTTLPKIVANQLNKFVERLLKGEEWADVAEDIVKLKTELETTEDIMSIGLPKGVNKVEEYTAKIDDLTARISGHIAAAIHYNMMLEEHDDTDSPMITSGTKIKVFYLTQMYGRFKSIAIPTDIEVVPQWFYDNFTVKREMHVERLVDKPLQNILTAIERQVPDKQDLHVESLLEF